MSDDRNNVLSLAMENQQRDGKGGLSIGGLGINKSDGGSGYGYDVAELLVANNGTIFWNVDDPITGKGTFNTIYEYMAAEIHAPGQSLRIKIEAAEDYQKQVRSGVKTLAEWLDVQWGVPLFRCKLRGLGNKVGVITVHGNIVVDEITGITAAQQQRNKDKQAIQGVTKAAYRRIGRQFGETEAAKALQDAVENILSENLPVPRRKRIL